MIEGEHNRTSFSFAANHKIEFLKLIVEMYSLTFLLSKHKVSTDHLKLRLSEQRVIFMVLKAYLELHQKADHAAGKDFIATEDRCEAYITFS